MARNGAVVAMTARSASIHTALHYTTLQLAVNVSRECVYKVESEGLDGGGGRDRHGRQQMD